MKKNFYSTEEILEMLENMNDDSENKEQAKEEFDKSMNGSKYNCPIPAEIPVP